MEIINLNSEIEASASAGEALNHLLLEHIKKPVLLLLSGGSAFSILEYVSEKTLGENLTVCMLDERYSESAETNNFLQLQKTEFYSLALNAGINFFGSLPRANESKEDFAGRMEKNLNTWITENSKGKIIAVLGMGADGHTAGIFPNPNAESFKKLYESENLVVSHDLGPKNSQERVTITLNFLKKIDFGIAFICGQKKQIAFNSLKSGTSSINHLPVLALKEIKDLKIYTDLK